MQTIPAPRRPTAPPRAPVGRRRRPSGEPPPLPRHVDPVMRAYLVLGALLVLLWVALSTRPGLRTVTAVDTRILRAVTHVRVQPLTDVLQGVARVASVWTVAILAWGTIAVLVAFRRFQYLAAYLTVVLVVSVMDSTVAITLGRMRPAGVTSLTPWAGYADPSLPVAGLALVLVGALYTLVPGGRARSIGKAVAAALLAAVCAARLYLGVDHPSDLVAALIAGWALPVVAFRLLVPESVFPISYRGGRRAHLDMTGERGRALIAALDQQLGIDAVSVEPFGLEGSAGSTPLRIRVRGRDGAPDTVLFAKLYALSHLRSDRWYKLTRTIFYGRLEDEKPFSSVRRLVEYEDHMLRLMRDAGLPTPRPYGFVEITPEREYAIVMEFFEGAGTIGPGAVDTALIDDALATIRRLWDAGLAHRDIKPSNLLVRGHRLLVIDVAFATVRPTPWRQAVDLANTMLTLALWSTPEMVYERALRTFTPDEIAEAFAASRGITVPTQLRNLVRADGRDLTGAFRRLAPRREPVPIQVWSFQRVAVSLSVVVLIGLAGLLFATYVQVAGLLGTTARAAAASVPACTAVERVALIAQSVPGAAYVPCVADLGQGWSATGFDAGSAGTRFSLVSDRAPGTPVRVEFSPTCSVAGAVPTAPRGEGIRSYIRLDSVSPSYRGATFDVFPGGCVTSRFDFVRGPHIVLMEGFGQALGLTPIRQLRLDLDRRLGVELQQ